MAVPNASPFETDFARRIRSATALVLGREIEWVPGISTGFTDSRFTRPLGTVTYGFSGSHPDDDPMLGNVHGTDESVGINSLISGTQDHARAGLRPSWPRGEVIACIEDLY